MEGRLYAGYYCTAFPRFRSSVGMVISAMFLISNWLWEKLSYEMVKAYFYTMSKRSEDIVK